MPDWKERFAHLPWWRREPYRLFFPLGVLLLWAALLPWLSFALGLSPQFRPVYHSIAQIEGFLSAFAAGFLFTALPRRTDSPPPGAGTILVALLAPPLTLVPAWGAHFGASQGPWACFALVLFGFTWRRLRPGLARRRAPAAFVWIPIGLLFGLGGVACMAYYGLTTGGRLVVGRSYPWHEFGRNLLLQGMFLAWILGLGALVFPLLTRGESAPDDDPKRPGPRRLHLAAALLLFATFVVETPILPWPAALSGRRPAYVLRALLLLAELILGAGLHRPPAKPGLHRRFLWLAAWCLPAGYLFGALLPAANHQAGLHVVFVGGFAWLALSVGLHVTLAHGARPDLVAGRSLSVPAFGLLLLGALAARVLYSLDPSHPLLWLGLASGLLLLATIPWALRLARGLAG